MPRRLIAMFLALPLGCFADTAPGDDSETSEGSETGSGTGTGSTSGTTGPGVTNGTSGESTGEVPEPQPWDGCQQESDCPLSAPLCLIDDHGRGICSRICEGDLQCPTIPSGDATAVCSPKKVCLLNCSGVDGDLACPDDMFCTDTTYQTTYSGGVCLWDQDPDVCADVADPCFVGDPDCCDGLACVDGFCG